MLPEVALSDTLLSASRRFAHGAALDDGTATWPTYDGASDRSALVDATWGTLRGFRDTQCDFRDGIRAVP